ncbi:hypothetical protein [Azospirillum melinis]
MNAKGLERFLVSLTPWGATEIDQRTRNLRVARMLPTGGGRGLNAPEIGPEQAATVLISLAVSDRAVDAVQSVLTYAPLKPATGGQFDGFGACETFGEALTLILEDYGAKYDVEEVVICRTWPMAIITRKAPDGEIQEFVYGYDSSGTANAEGYRASIVRVETRFSGGFLHQLAIDLHSKGSPVAAGEWVSTGSDRTGRSATRNPSPEENPPVWREDSGDGKADA